MKFKQAVRNAVEPSTVFHRFGQYLCSVREFKSGDVSINGTGFCNNLL